MSLKKPTILFFYLLSGLCIHGFAADPKKTREILSKFPQPYLEFEARPARTFRFQGAWTLDLFNKKKSELVVYRQEREGWARVLGRYHYPVRARMQKESVDKIETVEVQSKNSLMADIMESTLESPNLAEAWTVWERSTGQSFKARVQKWVAYIHYVDDSKIKFSAISAELLVESPEGEKYLLEYPLSLSNLTSRSVTIENFDKKDLEEVASLDAEHFAHAFLNIGLEKALRVERTGRAELTAKLYEPDVDSLLAMEKSTYRFQAWTRADFVSLVRDPKVDIHLAYVMDPTTGLRVKVGYCVVRREVDHVELLGIGVRQGYTDLGIEDQILKALQSEITKEVPYIVARLPKIQHSLLKLAGFKEWDEKDTLKDTWRNWHSVSLINTTNMQAAPVEKIPLENTAQGLWVLGTVNPGAFSSGIEEPLAYPNTPFPYSIGTSFLDNDKEEFSASAKEGFALLDVLKSIRTQAKESEAKKEKEEIFEDVAILLTQEKFEELFPPATRRDLAVFFIRLNECIRELVVSDEIYYSVKRMHALYEESEYLDKQSYAEELAEMMDSIREALHPSSKPLIEESAPRIAKIARNYLDTKRYQSLPPTPDPAFIMKHVIHQRWDPNQPYTHLAPPPVLTEDKPLLFLRKDTGSLNSLATPPVEENLIFHGTISDVWLFFKPKFGNEVFSKGNLYIPEGFLTYSENDPRLHYPSWGTEEVVMESGPSLWERLLAWVENSKPSAHSHFPQRISLSNRKEFLFDFRQELKKYYWAIRAQKLGSRVTLNHSGQKHYQAKIPQKDLFIDSWVLVEGDNVISKGVGATYLYAVVQSEDENWANRVVRPDFLEEAELDLRRKVRLPEPKFGCSTSLLAQTMSLLQERKL